jgi:hypothetical protein
MNEVTEAPTQQTAIVWSREDKLKALLLYLDRLLDDGVRFRLSIDFQPRSDAEGRMLKDRMEEFSDVFQLADEPRGK